MAWRTRKGANLPRALLLTTTLLVVAICAAGTAYLLAPQSTLALVSEVRTRIVGERPVPCSELGKKERFGCWDTQINNALKDGIQPSLALLETFSKAFPNFITMCHSYAHIVGKSAYEAFLKGDSLSLSPAMQLCDFGFFHGFMTEFITQSNDPLEMRRFCTRMEAVEEAGARSYSRDACFHGIGHGSVENHNPDDWGNPRSVLRQTLRLCRAAAENDHDYEKCAGGTYNGMSYGTYGKEILDKTDPFGICRGLTQEDVPAECYGNLAAVVLNLTKNKSLQEGIDLARSYQEYPHFERAIATFAAMTARQPNSQEESMRACNALTGRLPYHCMWGYVSGLVQSEVPDSRQQKAYDLCSGGLVKDDMRGACFEGAFNQLRDFWSKEKIVASCELAPHAGRTVCAQALSLWIEKQQ